jgi:hypothetical protein
MAVLNSKERKALPNSDFALPGRRYPIENRAHAQAALARVAQYGTAQEIAEVHRKVREKYPDMVMARESHKATK